MCTARSRTALAFSREQSRELARARTISLRNRTYVGDCRARMTYELACVRGRLARGEASRASPHLLAASAKFWTSEVNYQDSYCTSTGHLFMVTRRS